MLRICFRQVTAMAALSVAFACADAHAREPPPVPAANWLRADLFWVPANATMDRQRKTYQDGTADVGFSVAAMGTRQKLTARLTTYYADKGWNSRSTEWLNPSIPTSIAAGWRTLPSGVITTDAAGRRLPRSPMYAWTGEWENGNGDAITYRLMALDDIVRVFASYYPARVILTQRQRLGLRRGP